MQVFGQRHERQPFAQVLARLSVEQRGLPGWNRRGQPPVANDRREHLHLFVEERKQHQRMPVANHAKDPRRRSRAVQDQQRPGERQVHRDQPDAAWKGIPEDRDQRGRDRQVRRRQRRRPARKINGGHRRYDPSMLRPERMLRTFDRKWREARMVARGFQSASHPILAQIVPIRRCNLACTYCNEYDKHSPPVALATMRERIDHLARLRTANVEISGGEPLLHPDLDELIRHIRGTGALAGLITNGYLLNEKRIERFNDVGLDHLQISIDNVKPDDTSKKSLKVLDAKLRMLAKRAAFSVNINSVLGGDLSQSRGRTDGREAGDRTGSDGDSRPDPQQSRPLDATDAGAVARLQ